MNFEEPRVSGIDVRVPESLYQFIVKDLCGETYFRPFDGKIKSQIQAFIETVGIDGLNYEQFNELLLLFNQDRVSRAFFKFFFDPDGCVKLDALPKRIVDFRGFAMLCFGDFRFAYKKLSRHDEAQLVRELDPYSKTTASILTGFAKRPPPSAKDRKDCEG